MPTTTNLNLIISVESQTYLATFANELANEQTRFPSPIRICITGGALQIEKT